MNIRFINLDAEGYCWRDSDTRLPETYADRDEAENEAYPGDETFACTVNPDGSVTLADGVTVVPATDEPTAPTEPDPRLVSTDYDPNS